MADLRGAFEDLITEHDNLAMLRVRLSDELANTAELHVESDEAASLRTAIKEFLTAHREPLDFENGALVPALAPFLAGHDAEDAHP